MTVRILLVSDLDDTILGDEAALERFAEFCRTLGNKLALVYASGRFHETILRDVQNSSLPEPLATIGGVGSEIRSFPGGELNQHWVERISPHWSAQTVREVLADEPSLELQEESAQGDFKVSYYFKDASQEQIDQLQARLTEAGLKTSLIYSSQRDLDVLPQGVNKGSAAAFIAKDLGFERERTLAAGNSGNDSKLFEHEFYGIIVSNAHDELKQYASDPQVYLSPHARADGVRDGIQHWMGVIAQRDALPSS